MAVFISGGENRKIPSPFDCLNYGLAVIYYHVHSFEKASRERTFSDSMTLVEGSALFSLKLHRAFVNRFIIQMKSFGWETNFFSGQQRRAMKQMN